MIYEINLSTRVEGRLVFEMPVYAVNSLKSGPTACRKGLPTITDQERRDVWDAFAHARLDSSPSRVFGLQVTRAPNTFLP